MSLEKANTIDVIGVNRGTGEVILTISDHLEWELGANHLSLLQKKINTYIRFIESGEITRSYPRAKNKKPVIKVHAKYEPDDEGLTFLAKVKRMVEAAGFGFEFERLYTNSRI
jgi:hypothetical protein